MVISSDLLDKIYQYLDNQITISELEEWLVSREPSLLREPESDDSDIIGAIELGFVDMSAGSITEDEFRELLRKEVRSKTETIIRAVYPPSNTSTTTDSTNRIVSPPFVYSNQYEFTVKVGS